MQDELTRPHTPEEIERALRESEEKYRLLFSGIDEGFCIIEVLFDSAGKPVDYRFLETNPVFERQTGLVDAVGKSMRALAPEHEERWFEIYGQIALTGDARRFEDPAAALGRFFDVFAFRIGEPEQRRVAILFRDIGERKRVQDALRESEERQAFLLKLSDALRPLADAAAIQAATTRMIGEHLAVDRAMYAEVEGPVGAEVGTICCQFIRPARAGEATAVPFPERFLFKPYGEHRMAARYRGDLLVVANIDDDPRADAAERAAWAAANVRSAIVAPLVKDGRLVAEFGVHCEEPRDWMEAEQSLIREVAERTWAAAERARAEAGLREIEERHAFLLELSDALRPLTDSGDIERTATRLLGEHLKADRCFLSPVYDDGLGMCVREEYLRSGASSVLGDYTFAQFGDFVGPTLHAGHNLAVEDVSALSGLSAGERASYAAVEVGAYLLIPVTLNGRLAAFLTINHRTPRGWSDADKAVARQTADRLWTARERARAEAALSESEELRRLALAGGRMGAWRWDLNKRLVSGDPKFMSLYGLPPTDGPVDLSLFTERMSPESAVEIEKIVTRAISAGEEFDGPILIETGPTAGSWVQWRGCTSPGDASILQGVTYDITQQKRAGDALSASEERQSFLLMLSDKLRAVVNAQEVQRAACRLLGEQLEADRVYYLENDTESGRGIVLNDYAVDGLPSLAGEYPHETFATTYRRLGDGQTWIVHDAAIETSIDEQEREYFLDQSVRAWIDVPLIKDGRLEAVLCVVQSDARAWTPADIALVEDVADRTWAAVERARVERALREEERLRTAMLDVLPLGLALTDTGGRVVLSNREWARLIPTKRIPSRDQDRGPRWRSWNEDGELVQPENFPTARALRGEHVDPPMEFLYVEDDGQERWTSVAAIPFRDSSDEIIGAVCVIQDIDAAKRASESLQDSERHAQVLLAELQHRVRNTLAVVRSIARRTADRTETQADFVSHFEGRLSAFSRVQAVVTRSPDSGVALRTLVEDELLALAARDGNHIKISGPDVCLTSRAAETISLAIHELATNAIKYGALSAPRGRVQVNWSCLDGGGKDDLRFEWRERGLDSRPAASREGFGHELLLRSLPYDLDAKTEIVFEEDGLRFLMTLPMTAEVIASGERRSTQ